MLRLVKNPCFITVQDTEKPVLLFCACKIYIKANEEAQAMYYTVIKHSAHLRTLKKQKKVACGSCFLHFPHVLKCLSCFIAV